MAPNTLNAVGPRQLASRLVQLVGTLLVPHQPAASRREKVGVVVPAPQDPPGSYGQQPAGIKWLGVAADRRIVPTSRQIAASPCCVVCRVRDPIRRISYHQPLEAQGGR